MPFFHKKLCMLLCLLGALSSRAIPNYHYTQISIDEGLSESAVTAILRDSKGILWIGTRSGLNKYDKSNIEIFLKEIGNAGTLPGNEILSLAEDAEGNIWVGTNNGLAVYDTTLDLFTLQTDEAAYSALRIGDELLFGGIKCLYRYTPSKEGGALKRIPIDFPEESGQLFLIRKMLRNPDGRIVLGASHGKLYNFDIESNTVSRHPGISVPYLISLHLGSDGAYYISSYKDGLYRYDPDGVLTTHWMVSNSALSSNIITDILEPTDGELWLSTDGGGICIFDMAQEEFSTIQHRKENPNSLPTNSLTLLYKDYDNNIWAGSVRNGLLSIKKSFIKTFSDVSSPSSSDIFYGLSEKTVISLFEDFDGMLWVGTDGGGINAYNPTNDTFCHFRSTYGESITSITAFDQERLLISIFNKGTYLFSKQKGILTPFIIQDKNIDRHERLSGITPSIHRINDEKIYILSSRNYVYHPRTKTFSEIQTLPGEQMPIALNLAYVGEQVSYGFLGNRIFEIDHRNDKLRQIFTMEEGENIASICCEDPGRLWISSDWGVSHYDLTTRQFTRIPTKLFNMVSYMVADGPDRLWICANNKLFSLQISTRKFSTWNESDGFLPNEIIKTFQYAPRGRNIYLGGVNGLVVIDRNYVPASSDVVSIHLQDVMLNGKACRPNSGGKEYTIPHNYTSLSLSTYTQEKDIFRKVLLRYTIQGLSEQIIETQEQNLNLPMLPPGDYTVWASCNTKNGEWSPKNLLAYLRVVPPWYRSGWAVTVFTLLIVAFALLGIFYLHRRNQKKFLWQTKLYEQKVNEKKIQFLVNISHELRTPLTLICAPLKRILKGIDDSDPTKENLTAIYHQARYMKDIVNMVLDINKLDQGKLGLTPTLQPFNAWMEEIVNSFTKEFAENGIELAFTPDPNLGVCSFDRAKLRIVVSNLLSNALKFSPAGTNVHVSTLLCDGMIQVSVADQGVGLRNIDKEQLFTRFYQGNPNGPQGNGIGLAYSRQLIELHGGMIHALDNENGGAIFQFKIPYSEGEETNTSSVVPAPIPERKIDITTAPDSHKKDFQESCRKYSILVVEDNLELRHFMRDIFKEYFKNVYTARNGEIGLETTLHKRPDIVISDVMMPVMNGFELCRRIKEEITVSHTMVILLTAMGDSDSTSYGYKLGADFYLAKPFEMETLLSILCNQLKGRERIRELYNESTQLLSPVETTSSSADEQFLIRLNRLITENMNSQTFSIQFLVDRIGVGRTTFYQKVKILTGMSVNEYINKLRINQALQLLESSDATISEIADKVGFSYQCHFSTAFKQITGMTPTEYRQSKKQ